MAVDTGLGGTISFATSGFTGNMREIGGATIELDDLETSHLGTTGYKTYTPSDLAEPGEFECEIFWDAEVAASTVKEVTTQPILGTVESIVKTYPGQAGNTAANITGTGYIKSFTRPTMQVGELMMASVTVKWDGGTGPTFTAEA